MVNEARSGIAGRFSNRAWQMRKECAFSIVLLMALATGGCPSTPPASDDPNESTVAGTNVVNDAFPAPDLVFGTFKNQSLRLSLPAPQSGITGAVLVTGVSDGSLSQVSSGAEPEFRYAPPADFLGKTQFTYRLEAGPNTRSTIGTVTLHVHPPLRFRVTSEWGDELVAVTGRVVTDAGEDAPASGSYRWSIAGQVSEGGAAVEQELAVRSSIAVSVQATLPGMAAFDVEQEGTGATVAAVQADVVTISGAVLRAGGEAVSGVLLSASGVTETTETAADGQYAIVVPRGWSGSITPNASLLRFTPALRSYVNVQSSQFDQDFAAGNVSSPPPPPPGEGLLVVENVGLWQMAGRIGGPFAPAQRQYVLTNAGEAPFDWSAGHREGWIALDDYSGRLEPGESVTVTAGVTSEAESMAAGEYTDNLAFVNQTYGLGSTSRSVLLAVGRGTGAGQLWVGYAPPFNASGSLGGPFTPSNADYLLANVGGEVLNWEVGEAPAWLQIAPSSGSLAPGQVATVHASVTDMADDLAEGTYAGDIVFGSSPVGRGGASFDAELTVGPPPVSRVLWVADVRGYAPVGFAGGVFKPALKQYMLINLGSASLTWAADPTADWVVVSPPSGQLGSGKTTIATVTLADGSALPAGALAGTLHFNNVDANVAEQVPLAVTVHGLAPESGLVSQGPTGGPFAPASQTYTLTNNGANAINWTAGKQTDWVSLSQTGGTLAAGASTTITVSINSAANALPAGAVGDTVTFTDTIAGVSTTRGVALAVNAAPASLQVTPATGIASSGTQGGPFSPSTGAYTLTNNGGTALTWSATKSVSWLTLSATGGTLQPGDTATVNVTINSTANSLGAGNYSSAVTFTNATNGVGNTSRNVTLAVAATPGALSVTGSGGLTSSGVQGGPFAPASINYTLRNTGGQSINWTAADNQSWISVSPASGTLAGGGQATLTVSISSGANSLAPGSYNGMVTITNATNGAGNTTRSVGLTVNTPPGSLAVTPAGGSSSSGAQGGPFSPSSFSYTLTNSGGQSLTWSATKNAGWLTLSSTGGTLAPSASTVVNATINSGANALAQGNYSGTVTFTNSTNGAGSTSRTIALAVSSPAGCVNSTTGFQNFGFASQTGVFTAEFDVRPQNANMDGVLALSNGNAATFTSCAAIVRFDTTGLIDVRNGGTYDADASVAYVVGGQHHVRMLVNVANRTYTVWVTPPGGSEQLLASSYAFRSEQASVTQLNNWTTIATPGVLEVCNFTLTSGANQPPVANGGADQTVTDVNGNGSESVTLSAAGSTDVDGTITNYAWHEGATLLAQGANATTSVTLPVGVHNLILTVTDNGGLWATDAVRVTVVAGGGSVLSPIARWDVVPHQRLIGGQPFNAGVVAFSKAGIQKVVFTYGNQTQEATNIALNPRTGVYEYFVPVNVAGAGLSAGSFNLNATVIGADGGQRVLPALQLVADPSGTLPKPEAWVDAVLGSDTTGTVNDSSKPFRTPLKAIQKIRDWKTANGHGSSPEGGIVRLKPGTHQWNAGGVWDNFECANEWVIVTTASGGTRANTTLANGDGASNIRKLCFRGLTLSGARNPTESFGATSAQWIDDCTANGSGRWIFSTNVVGINVGSPYYTNSALNNMDFGVRPVSTKLARGLTISQIGNDAFQNVPLVINCVVDNVDPGTTGWHADVIGDSYHGPSMANAANRIVYGLRATNCHYQGIFCNYNTGSITGQIDGQAFVNVFIELRDPIASGGGFSGWYSPVNHLLMWNMTLVRTGGSRHDLLFHADGAPEQQTNMTNVSVVGCMFEMVTIDSVSGKLSLDMSDWRSNHFVAGSTRGIDATSGSAQLDANWRPSATSPLRNRVTPLKVPVDAAGALRGTPGEVGAFEQP